MIRHRMMAAGWFLAAFLFMAPAGAGGAETEAAKIQAKALWDSFLEKYHEFSLSPLSDEKLDAQAREQLLHSLGLRYNSWHPDDYSSIGALIEEIEKSGPERSSFDFMEQTLVALLPVIDKYGDYETASNSAKMLEARKQKGGGSVQITVQRDKAGRFLCYPQPDGPADQAKILRGAELLEVDGIPIERKELIEVKFACMGPPSSMLRLKVRQPHGKVEEMTIKRDVEPPSVYMTESALGLNVRIRKFDEKSAKTLREILNDHQAAANKLTLDLRGNPGGIRDQAYNALSLFFPKGAVLGMVTTREGTETLKNGRDALISPKSIRILINSDTGSSAEILAAGLKEAFPDKVKIFGEHSYGKSNSTAAIPVAGGGVLTLTEASLATASGMSWDKTGIKPDVVDEGGGSAGK